MPELVRLGLSMDERLLAKLDGMVHDSKYTHRSEFVRDMLRQRLVEEEWERDAEVVGTVTLIYDHHFRRLSEKLTDLQHHHHEVILATTHVHLDEEMCAEMILMKGRAGEIKAVADHLRQHKGVLHAALSMSSTGRALV